MGSHQGRPVFEQLTPRMLLREGRDRSKKNSFLSDLRRDG